MEPSSPFVQYHEHLQVFIQPFLPISAPQTMSKRLIRKSRRRTTRGCQIKTNAESGVEDYQRNSNSAEFEYVSKPRDTYSNKFKFGFHRYGKPVARDSNAHAESSSQVRQPYVNPSSSTGTFVAETTQNFVGAKWSHHNMKLVPNNVDDLEKVYSNVRRELGRPPNDDMEQIDVNMIIWVIFMSATMKAAVHLR